MIEINRISKAFGTDKVLDQVNFTVKEGEIVVLLGPSGTGKTVLLKTLIGLMEPDEGHVVINGVNITELGEDKLLKIRRDMGYLFQEGALYDFMDVFDNIAFPLREHTDLKESLIASKVKEILRMVDLEDVEERFPAELSGGMKKRVGLARAIVLGAKVLLCDEPTSGLDPIRSRHISDMIRSISKKLNCTTVITSHDIANSFRIADRLVLLNDGHIVIMGTKEDLRGSRDPFVMEFMQTAGQ